MFKVLASSAVNASHTQYWMVSLETMMTPKAHLTVVYLYFQGGNPVEITNPVYSHTETGDTPVYYMSQCSVSVSVQELGKGTHSFTGYIYPGVRGDPAKVTGTRADKTVTLSKSDVILVMMNVTTVKPLENQCKMVEGKLRLVLVFLV